ncbi:PD40 domain-containing protein [Verrucomicrobiaceae bacterium N1E253]|uniref:Tricorn protease homolog n=1 Tax=Oceaniferula marina TaxID=2748318 RepID=A0A851GKA0_9BACT|nr:S41 family peptidase [Oceaniferula marina]NWK54594.1 PD40 domain-containing protein [Oceaniferula marina]
MFLSIRFYLLALLLFPTLCLGAQPIRMASYPALSPDGTSLVFSWRGDIWKSSHNGGEAQRLTTHPARDFAPRFTPDGKSICFGSTRAGSYQVFMMPAKGGTARQITHHSEGSFLQDIAPDGKSVLVNGLRDVPGRKPYRFFQINLEERKPEQLVFHADGENGRYAPGGKSIIFTREGTQTYRKGYRGTQASQVWIWNPKAKQPFRQALKHAQGCRTPLFHPDGKGFFYTRGGDNGFNLHFHDLSKGQDLAITHFEDDSVMQPSIANDGSAIVFRHLFDLYHLTLGSDPSTPGELKKLDIWHEEDLDLKDHQDRVIKNTRDISFSPSGLETTFTAEGDIWAMDTILRKPKRLTDTPGYERDLWFSHDGTSIYYLYDDGLQTEIRQLKKSNPRQYWWEAEACTHEVIVPAEHKPTSITPDPKGNQIAYTTYPGTLWLSQPDGTQPVRLLESWDQPMVQWSPDGKWLTYALRDDNFNPDIYILKADGQSTPVNVSSHPDIDFSPVWSPNGRRLAFVGKHHDREFDIFYVELYQEDDIEDSDSKTREKARKAMQKDPAYKETQEEGTKEIVKKAIKTLTKPENKPKPTKKSYDLNDIFERVHRLPLKGITPSKLIWSHDSKHIIYQQQNGKSLYSIEAKAKARPVKLGDATGTPIRVDSKGKLYWLSDGVPATFYQKKNTKFSFNIYTSRDRTAWKRMVFRSAWNTMRDKFYDPSMNGRNWQQIREKYEDMAAMAPNSMIMDRIVNMMLGELNASHMGFRSISWPKPWKLEKQWKEETVHLGVRFDPQHSDRGWKIKEVIPRSPADHDKSRLEPGDVILSIGGEVVMPDCPITAHLNLRPTEPVQLKVINAKGESRSVKIQPISYAKARELSQKARLSATAKKVQQLSGGKLGYIHVARMMWDEFEQFQQHLYQQGVGKQGLIIDVRNNGGGFTTDHLLTALCQPNHAFTIPRNGGIGYPQDRTVYTTWNKPIIVLCNQNSYSNAEIFAHAIRNLNRGKIIGVETAGGVISTGSVKVLDAGTMRLPFRGWFSSFNGKDMEMNGAQPHITLWNKPGDMSRGLDIQLEKAVQILLKESKDHQTLPAPSYRSEW